MVGFKAGEDIVTQGDAGDAMYFLEAGIASAIKDGEEVFVFQAGDFFGETALMMKQPRAATVLAARPPSAAAPPALTHTARARAADSTAAD